tara:strand:+ start:194 stop:853 length:660 start_codon:yes stop_codon:yes gene_type:complete
MKDLPSFDETAEHLAAGVFELVVSSGEFRPRTVVEMIKQARANRDNAVKAWCKSGNRNGFDKSLDMRMMQFWTQEQKDAEKIAFDYYDSIFETIKADIEGIGSSIEKKQTAHQSVLAERKQIEEEKEAVIMAHRQLVSEETSKFSSQAEFEADKTSLKKVADSQTVVNEKITAAEVPLAAEVAFDADMLTTREVCSGKIKAVSSLPVSHAVLEEMANDI